LNPEKINNNKSVNQKLEEDGTIYRDKESPHQIIEKTNLN